MSKLSVKLTYEELSGLFGELYHLCDSGVSLGDSLALMAEESESKRKALLEGMASSADEGAPAHEVFASAGVFPEYVHRLLRVAAASGRADIAFRELRDHYTNRHRLERTLRSALGYPISLLAVLLTVGVILLVWVLPIFEGVYARMGQTMGGLAGGLLSAGGFLRAALPYIAAIFALILLLLAIPYIRARIRDLLKEKLGDKGVFKEINSARFLSALAMGLSSGMSEEEASDLAASLADSTGYKLRCDRVKLRLAEGEALYRALSHEGFIKNAHARRLYAAMRSGHGEEELSRIAKEVTLNSEEDLERTFSRTEPVIVGISCLIIGGILLGVMLPLINILNGMG